MSRRRPPYQSYLYGRPVTEWSTPPPSSTQEAAVVNQFQGMSLDHDSVPPASSSKMKPLPHTIPHHPTPYQSYSITSTIKPTTTTFAPSLAQDSATKHPNSQLKTSTIGADSKPKLPSGTQIPTALVTPLPGTSPPRHSGMRAHYQPTTRVMEGGEGEGDELWDEVRGKERALKVVGREHTHEVLHLAPMASGDNLELIEKWKALIDTKDRILKQKNAQIERLKATISTLQQDVRERDVKLRQILITNIREQGREQGSSALEERLQALEAENVSIRAQLAESLSARKTELHKLSSKLDHKEHELHQAVIGYAESSEETRQQVAGLHDEICRLQEHIRELEQKLAGAEAANEHHLEKIDRLNDYLGHMPSVEEHQALEQQARDTRIQFERVNHQLAEKELELENALTEASTKDILAQSLEDVKTELEDTRMRLESHKQSLALLEPQNRKLKQECHHLQKVVVEADRRCRKELQDMRERHRQRFVEATAKLRVQHKNLAKRAKALEMQLTKNSDAMMALNSELQLSQGTIGALKTSVRDLVTQNQELVEKNVSLQEVTAEAFKISSSLTEAQSAAAQQLGVELSRCVEEFESLVNLSTSLLEGQDPTATMLFGPEGHILSSDLDLSLEGGLEARLEQVKQLREKIEKLRTVVSEHFASQLSSACNVQ